MAIEGILVLFPTVAALSMIYQICPPLKSRVVVPILDDLDRNVMFVNFGVKLNTVCHIVLYQTPFPNL